MVLGAMDFSGSDLIGILVVVGLFVIPAVAGGFATLLKHREKMRKLQAENCDENERIAALEKRVKELEATCAKLNERVTDAHVLLSDEQRQLDSKLNAMLPPVPETAGDADREKARVRTQAQRVK